jgi:hypothetical protein
MRVRTKFLAVMIAGIMTTVAYAKENILPDACGRDKIDFEIATEKATAPPAPPADGKARIIFIETLNRPSFWSGANVSDIETRFGVDGAWVGATKSNTYFTVDIAPGEHHLCSSVRGSKDMIGVATVSAEAGKTYYFEYKIEPTVSHGHTNGGMTGPVSTTSVALSSGFSKLEEEEGKFRVKASKVAIATPNH